MYLLTYNTSYKVIYLSTFHIYMAVWLFDHGNCILKTVKNVIFCIFEVLATLVCSNKLSWHCTMHAYYKIKNINCYGTELEFWIFLVLQRSLFFSCKLNRYVAYKLEKCVLNSFGLMLVLCGFFCRYDYFGYGQSSEKVSFLDFYMMCKKL